MEGPKEQVDLYTLEELDTLLESPTFGDITIIVEDMKLRAHKKVLSGLAFVSYLMERDSSDYFAAMFGGFQESNMDTITIPDIPYELFKPLLQYLYGNTIRTPSSIDTGLSILLLADRFCMTK